MKLAPLELKEEEVLSILWKAGKPMISSEVVANIEEGHVWKTNSFHLIIKSLIEKGYVNEAGYVRSGKRIARLFAPAVTQEAYSSMCVVEQLNKYSANGQQGTLRAIASFLLEKDGKQGKQVIQELEKIIGELDVKKNK